MGFSPEGTTLKEEQTISRKAVQEPKTRAKKKRAKTEIITWRTIHWLDIDTPLTTYLRKIWSLLRALIPGHFINIV